MPAIPEIGQASAEVGKIEIVHRPDPEQSRNADGHIRISGKITVNLEGVEICAEDQVDP